MPIYEYRCTSCGHIAEEWVKSFNSPMSEPCPECGAEAVRIVSDTSFQLKGGGWYVTDYKKSGASQSHEPAGEHAAASTDAPAAASDAAASASGDAAPETPKAEAAKTEPPQAGSPSAATESKTASAAA